MFGLEREQCMGRPIGECLRGIAWADLLGVGKVVSRDVEIFYPQHRFVNFYIEPLRLEKPAATRPKDGYESEPVGYAVIRSVWKQPVSIRSRPRRHQGPGSRGQP
jgi:hypothetical protein